MIGIVPVLHKELELEPPGTGRRTLSDSGFGDATFLLKRRFYVNNFQGGGLQAAFIGGIKIPTGDDDERDERGELLRPDLQLGTGSVDVPVGVVFTAWRNRLGFNSEVIHQFNTESDGFEFGDETKINMALGYRLLPREFRSIRDRNLNAYLEINTSISRRASVAGEKISDSGGTQVFLTPGLQLVLTPRFLIEAAFRIPVIQELNGTQLDFAPNANLGIRLQF